MTTTAAAAIAARTAAQLRGWLSVRHSLRAEAIAVLVLYGLYELARGLVVGDPAEAERHAHRLVALERSLHLFVEANLQRAAHALPGLTSLLDVAYLTLHLAVTAAVLLWLHRRHAAAFPFVRTTLLLASGLALVGFLAYPTAPPRLAGVGIVDTVSSGRVDLNRGLISSVYNPYAAVPSMHVVLQGRAVKGPRSSPFGGNDPFVCRLPTTQVGCLGARQPGRSPTWPVRRVRSR
jgi:hypothetical protein